ncbi:hypothetical protein HK098_007986 [Nowakowskiella sp. JEL0407]|nr:hypothetical protein HK098_007986 [Nowakowskiella sp. JEL0407]
MARKKKQNKFKVLESLNDDSQPSSTKATDRNSTSFPVSSLEPTVTNSPNFLTIPSENITPAILSNPVIPPSETDSYATRWKRLIFMELKASLDEFNKRYESRRKNEFIVDINVGTSNGIGRCDCAISLAENVKVRTKSVVMEDVDDEFEGLRETVKSNSDDVIPPRELKYTLLRIPLYWIYVMSIDPSAEEYPCVAEALILDLNFKPVSLKQAQKKNPDTVPETDFEGFDAMLVEDENEESTLNLDESEESCLGFITPKLTPVQILLSQKHPATLSESFSTYIYRNYAVQQYTNQPFSNLRTAIESGVAMDGREDTFLPVSEDVSTKLNESQKSILINLKSCLDYVQGPPGTGKSTFITELVRLRIPSPHRVLVCTTTNKAIDSLAEKFDKCGFSDVLLAFGSENRLGEHTKRFLYKYKLENHHTFKTLRSVCGSLEVLLLKVQRKVSGIESKYAEEPAFGKKKKGKPDYSDFHIRRVLDDLGPMLLSIETLADRFPLPKIPSLHEAFTTLGKLWIYLESLKKTSPVTRELLNYLNPTFSLIKDVEPQLQDALKRDILESARIIVCTAATAVKLPMRFDSLVEEEQEQKLFDGDVDIEDESYDLIRQKLKDFTLESTSSSEGKKKEKRSLNIDFPYVILDEAGAMLEPDVIGCIIHKCRSLIVVGDPKQLPPFSVWDEGRKYNYNTTILSRLIANENQSEIGKNCLTIQYRMHSKICRLVSNLYYKGKVVTDPDTAKFRRRQKALVHYDIATGEKKRGTSYFNELEAEKIVEIVKRERNENYHENIIVITFYKAQMYCIMEKLMEEGLIGNESGFGGTVEVMTVDSSQGREADIVLLSCVRNAELGFTANRKRMNVAISRAKEILYIVGCGRLLNSDRDWRMVLDYCKR